MGYGNSTYNSSSGKKEMPEPEKKEEPKPTLDKTVDWVQSKQKNNEKRSSTAIGWFIGLGVGVIALIVIAFLSYYLMKRGKELAKLKHEKDVAEEDKEKAIADAKITELDDKKALLETDAKVIQHRIEEAEKSIARIEEERKELHNKIDKISSWEELENF